MRALAAVVAVVFVLAAPVPTRAWGMDVHRWLTRQAIDRLPVELKPFFAAKQDFITEHAADPDLWRVVDLRGQLGPEDPNHFLDIDDLDEPAPFAGVPRDWAAYLARYGEARATKAGRLPWRAEEIYKKLVPAMRDAGRGTTAYAADNARYLMAVLSHYVEDGHQPLHATGNYDGAATNQRGVHARFETELVLRNQQAIVIGAPVTMPITDIKTFMFDTVVQSQALVGAVLDADRKAATGRELYDDDYYKAFFAAARGPLERRLTDSINGVMNVVVAAWVEAGRPVLPVDAPRAPARIIRH